MLTDYAQLDPNARLIVVVFLIAVVFTVRRVRSARRWPYIVCQDCSSDKNSSPDGKFCGPCRGCGDSGQKLRLLAKVLGYGPKP